MRSRRSTILLRHFFTRRLVKVELRYNPDIMKKVLVPIPDSVVEMLQMDDSRLQQEFRMLIAAKMYEMGRLSAGAAAEVAGLQRLEFLKLLSTYCVSPINLNSEAVAEEIANAREIAQSL